MKAKLLKMVRKKAQFKYYIDGYGVYMMKLDDKFYKAPSFREILECFIYKTFGVIRGDDIIESNKQRKEKRLELKRWNESQSLLKDRFNKI